MAVYDRVAEQYAGVFDRIGIRRLEWPWIRRRIRDLRPRSVLDLGCGNGCLAEALLPLVPEVSGADPCEALLRLAGERLRGAADLRLAPAEELPFADGCFDAAVSLLSFRYMDWDRAPAEICRVLRPGGTFLVVDLFASGWSMGHAAAAAGTLAVSGLQRLLDPGYRRRLGSLCRSPDWRDMVREHPRREAGDARASLGRHFSVAGEKLLSMGVRGKTLGMICVKDGP